jgi:hypothetical protein
MINIIITIQCLHLQFLSVLGFISFQQEAFTYLILLFIISIHIIHINHQYLYPNNFIFDSRYFAHCPYIKYPSLIKRQFQLAFKWLLIIYSSSARLRLNFYSFLQLADERYFIPLFPIGFRFICNAWRLSHFPFDNSIAPSSLMQHWSK